MTKRKNPILAIFYCQNVLESGESCRQALEKEYGKRIRLFPIPCSGRLDTLHLLRALEEFADAAYVITCPEGACKYFEGNKRAKKRVEKARSIIESIGLEGDRIDILTGSGRKGNTLSEISAELMERARDLTPSPVHIGSAARSQNTEEIMRD